MSDRSCNADDLSNDSDITDDEIFDLKKEDSDDGYDIIGHCNKKLRRESECWDSSSQTNDEIFGSIPSTNVFTKTPNDFFETPGPRSAPPSDAKPTVYFNLFFTSLFLRGIAIETNRYAVQFLNTGNLKPKSLAKKWTPTTVNEIKAFIAVLLEMGITKRANIISYWNRDFRYIPWFGKMFTRDRFQLILKFFNLVDNRTLAQPGHPDYDPCGKFDYLIKHANTVFPKHYIPHQQLYIDESIVGAHCHSLCDSHSNYCLAFHCYKGAQSTDDKKSIQENGLEFTIVQKLLATGNYLSKGYHLFTNNFFTSLRLAKALLLNHTYLTGTIRHDRKEIPIGAKKANLGEIKYFTIDNVLLCSFKDKKSKARPVLLISTNADTNSVTIKKNSGHFELEKEQPSIIHDYNKYMGGDDISDQMLCVNVDERRTLKHWKKVAFNIFGSMVLNAYILYKSNATGKIMTRLQFTSEIIEDIGKKWMGQKNNELEQSNTSNKKFSLEKLPGRNLRQCVVCSKKSEIRRSNLICTHCKKGLHGLCAGKHICEAI